MDGLHQHTKSGEARLEDACTSITAVSGGKSRRRGSLKKVLILLVDRKRSKQMVEVVVAGYPRTVRHVEFGNSLS